MGLVSCPCVDVFWVEECVITVPASVEVNAQSIALVRSGGGAEVTYHAGHGACSRRTTGGADRERTWAGRSPARSSCGPTLWSRCAGGCSHMLITCFLGGEGEGPPPERIICPALDSI